MTMHDPLCQRNEPDHWCECALIARVRAELATCHCMWCVEGTAYDPAHAEAVAARLVEVICEMQSEADEEDAYFLTSYQRIRAERDAARAEVAALRAALRAEDALVIAAVEPLIRAAVAEEIAQRIEDSGLCREYACEHIAAAIARGAQ